MDDFDVYYGDDSTDFYANQAAQQAFEQQSASGYDPTNRNDTQVYDDLSRAAVDQADKDLLEQAKTNPSLWTFLSNAASTLGKDALNYAKNAVMTNGKVDFAKIATGIAAISALTGGDKPKSNAYQGSIPTLAATRTQVPYDYVGENREPGSYGRRYFSDLHYSAPAQVDAAHADDVTQGEAIKAADQGIQLQQAVKDMQQQPTMPVATPWNTPASPAPRFAKGGRYLDGPTDGMADKIPSTIDGHQKAALSHGEFVIPADVVSHLGNGNSNAGAQKLYDMMARVRKARTGNPHQGKEINPDKFLAGGIAAQYADGGDVKGFDGTTGSTVSTGTTGTGTGTTASTAIPSQGTSVAEGLSTWAGPYVSEMLGKGQALSNTPYQAYQGPLTAGASDLQEQQFGGLSNIARTGFIPGQTNYQAFDAKAAQQYMNPYTKAALDPQIAELQRQGQIQNLQNQAQATKMGTFGGSGSALMQTEGQRNTLDKIQQALGQGYNTAYNNATQQFNTDQSRQMQNAQQNEQNRQFSANYGLSTLQNLGTAGATQREIEAQGIAADKAQFEEEKNDPYKQVQFEKSLLQGLPITTTENTQMQSQLSQIAGQIAGLGSLYASLSGLGVTK